MLFPIFVFGNNRDKRSARGADPTTARTPLATRLSRSLGSGRYNRGPRTVRGGYAYAAHYARVIPVIAPYLNTVGRDFSKTEGYSTTTILGRTRRNGFDSRVFAPLFTALVMSSLYGAPMKPPAKAPFTVTAADDSPFVPSQTK